MQVHLAGFAAEHVLMGRRPRQLDEEGGFALVARHDPKLADAFVGSEDFDGHRAVQEVLKMGQPGTDDEIRRKVERFYAIARESLSAVWSAVAALAKALIEHEDLDRDGVDAVLGGIDIFTPVFRVQRAHGLLKKG